MNWPAAGDYNPQRWMQFVDGENLTLRAQAMLGKSDIRLPESPNYKRDCYLWPTREAGAVRRPWLAEACPIRSFYYTSMIGAEPALQDVRMRLRNLDFEPHVFKKIRQELKAKGVDIALTKDMLSHAFRGNYDTALLVAGDGDYLPLVEEVKRLGKRIMVRFIGQCTAKELRLAADEFEDITQWIQNWAFPQGTQGSSERPASRKTSLNINIDPELLERIDEYQVERMYPTRTEAIEMLLDAGLRVNPEKPASKGE